MEHKHPNSSIKVKGGALLFSLVFSLIILIILSSIILLSYYKRMEMEQLFRKDKLLLNATSGLNLLLASEQSSGNVQLTDLYETGNDSVKLAQRKWGVFEIISSTAMKGGDSYSKAAMVGYKPDKSQLSALYIADLNRPVSVCGKTVIRGTAYLPEAGVKRAYIEGQSYMGSELVYGQIKKSTPAINALNQEQATGIENMLHGNWGADMDMVLFDTLRIDSVYRSFTAKPLCVYSSGEIVLNNKYFHGQIILASTKRIVVKETSTLSDIILVAPGIIFSDNVKANAQLLASDSILIGKKCEFSYPSAAVLLIKNEVKYARYIKIGEQSRFSGIACCSHDGNSFSMPKLSLEKDTEFEGMVYSSGYVESKGKVYGNITCYKMLLVTPSSVYENHLLNTEIDITKLSKHFVATSLLVSEKEKGVIKWLY